jgi:predicted flap endonuclease-1-like 5' DNA nuclease
MANSIIDIEGIGASFKKKLHAQNIQTTDDLLRTCGSKKGRETLSAQSGIGEKNLLEWTNLADLMRVKGVGEEYADLLEEAGVDTVKELAARNAESLSAAMKVCNQKKKLAKRVPSPITTTKWIAEAKKLKPMVSH